MLKLRVLTSFTYYFKDKVHHFKAGEYYHLWGEKDAEEILHILSPDSPYRRYFRIEQSVNSLKYISHAYTKGQLQNMHYTKIQEIAESKDIEYTTKAETIDAILEKELQTT